MEINKRIVRAITLLLVILFMTVLPGCSSNNTNKAKADKGFIDLSGWDFEKNGIAKLDGEWELYWNQLYTPEDFRNTSLKPDGYIYIPFFMDEQYIGGKKLPTFGYATLRLKIKVNGRDGYYGLKTKSLLTASKVWVDGFAVAEQGIVGRSKAEEQPLYIPTVSYFNTNDSEIEIIVQMSNFYDINTGIEGVRFGTGEQINYLDRKEQSQGLLALGCLLIMSFYHFGLFMRRKKDASALYFSAVCFCFPYTCA
ncbi:MAG: hypothetical protein ACM3TR_13105 [Caulobacteraceae bacterium]